MPRTTEKPKKPLRIDDVEQAIREVLRVATLWVAEKRAGRSPGAMTYHEDFLRTVCQSALRHWDKQPLKKVSNTKDVLRNRDFRSYAVLMHIMDALAKYQQRGDRSELVQYIQAAMVVLGPDRDLRHTAADGDGQFVGMRFINQALAQFDREQDKGKKLEKSMRRTAGAILEQLGGTSSTKLYHVRDVVEDEGPEDLAGSIFRPLFTRRQLEEHENGRHVSYVEIREFALRLLGLSPVAHLPTALVEDSPAKIDDSIDPDLPEEIRALVEKARRDGKASARYRAKYPSSRDFPLIGDDDVAPLAHQPPKRTRVRSASRKAPKG